MRYNPQYAEFYALAYETERRLEREAEIHQRIHEMLSRLNEDELKLVLGYTAMVYKKSDAYELDKQYGQNLVK